jgi:hypothetical protein
METLNNIEDVSNQAKYKALVHAIWRIDSMIREVEESDTPSELVIHQLSQERRAIASVAAHIKSQTN